MQTPAAPTAAPAGLAPHRGTTVLVLGILALVLPCCFVLGIIAWVMGSKDLKEIAAGRMDPAGQGSTNAGKICGMISVLLGILAIVVWIISMIAGLSIFAALFSGLRA